MKKVNKNSLYGEFENDEIEVVEDEIQEQENPYSIKGLVVMGVLGFGFLALLLIISLLS